jgi:hypothetical protein
MRNRKIHIKLPLKVPQNILDMFVEYRRWRKDHTKFPRDFKEKWMERLTAVCKKWHLYSGWESMAGSYWIHTKVGITVYTHIGEDKPLTIHQCTNFGDSYNPWYNKYPHDETGTRKGQDYVYDWRDYAEDVLPD